MGISCHPFPVQSGQIDIIISERWVRNFFQWELGRLPLKIAMGSKD
jgi:hypothetical protein